MPALGADMDEGTILEWLVKPGDEVHKGDVIAVIDTAKAAIDAEPFHTGTVEQPSPDRCPDPEGRVARLLGLARIPAAGVEVSTSADGRPCRGRLKQFPQIGGEQPERMRHHPG